MLSTHYVPRITAYLLFGEAWEYNIPRFYSVVTENRKFGIPSNKVYKDNCLILDGRGHWLLSFFEPTSLLLSISIASQHTRYPDHQYAICDFIFPLPHPEKTLNCIGFVSIDLDTGKTVMIARPIDNLNSFRRQILKFVGSSWVRIAEFM